ncbi:MAG TPA: gliding motility-associated C-terminal domain-containing protein [Bacteroidales bacterium]
MKKLITCLFEKAKQIIALLLFLISIASYSQTCEVTLRNDSLIDANNLIVDIYVKSTSGIFYYSGGQFKILYNKASIANGGTISGTIVPGFSDLTNATQYPTTVITTATTSFRVVLEAFPTSQTACSQLSTTGFGTRIGRVKLTNTVAFGEFTADMQMTIIAPNATAIWYAAADASTNLSGLTLVNTNLVNPFLNQAITSFNVTGNGSSPSVVGLDGSQTGGVNYLLYKGVTSQGSSINGTGSALSFGSQTEGTYTVKAHRKATYMYSDMTGSAVVTSAAPTAYSVTGGGAYCQGTGGLPVGLINSELGVTYTLYKNAIAQVPTVAGTGASISFGNQLFGTYTVSGTNGGGTTAMTGSTVLTENPAPSAPTGTAVQSFCSATSPTVANLTASGTAIQWYAASSGGTALATSTPLVNGTHYFATQTVSTCESTSRFDVTATVNTTPAAPTGTAAQLFCSATSPTVVNLTASGTAIQWYAASSGGTALATSAALATSHYFASQTVNGCESTARFDVTVTVNTTPSAPTGTAAQSFCSATSPTVASLSASGTAIKWYAASSGGTALATSTPLVNGTHYFATQTVSTCESTSRFDVTITVNTTPAAPTGTAAQTFCSGTSPTVASLTATGTAVQWYAASSGGTALATSGALATGHYFASQTVNGCESTARFDVTVTVNTTPSAPTGTAAQSFCSATSPTVASLTATGTAVQWYAASSGGTALATSAALATGHYFASQTVNGCESTARFDVTVTVNTTPAAPTGTAAQSFCSATSPTVASLSASGTAIKWYAASSGGTTLATSTLLVSGTHYFASQTLSTCESTSRLDVTVTINSIPNTPGTISGTATQCPSLAGQVYSISSVANATTYAWTVPTGWSITAGQGTISVSVTTGLTGDNGDISVTAGNSCGTSSASSLAVTVNPAAPASPGLINGTVIQCPSLTGQVYSIGAVPNASTYTWITPTGWLITAGQGSASITVTTGTAGQNGNISVTAANSCGTSVPSLLGVSVVSTSVAPTGVSISNNNTCTGTTKTLTVTGGSLGSGASWQWFTGSCGGSLAGTGPSLTVDLPAGTSTIYYVLATGTCNTTACATGTVVVTPTVGNPSVPVPSATTICQGGSSTTYTTSASNATSYNWTVTGTGNTISGTGTTGTVAWAPGFYGVATIAVTANGCGGISTSSSTTATVRPTPTASVVGTTAVCQNSAAPDITFINPQTLPITVTYNINGGTNSIINVGANISATVSVPTNIAGIFVYNLVSVAYQAVPGCSNNLSGSATVTVNAIPVPTLSSSDADNIICAGTNVTFTAGGGTNYNFRIGGTTIQNGPSSTYSTSTLTNGQVVNVVVTNASGCSANSSGITNFVNSLPFIFVSGSPTCSGDKLTYSLAVTVGSGTVTSTAGIVTNLGSNVWSVTGVNSGINIIVKVTDIAGCESVVAVTAPNCSCPVILPPVGGGDKSYCASEAIPTISASVPVLQTVDWYSSASGGTPLLSSSLTYTPPAPGTYYALAHEISSPCVSSTRTAIIVTMNPLPLPTISSSDANNIFCAGTSVTFTAAGGTGYNFRVNGSSKQNGSSTTYTTSALTTGQIVDVIVTNANGCVATSSGITNTVNPLPTATLSSSDADNKFCEGTSITFTAGGGTNYNFRVDGVSVQNSVSNIYTTTGLTNTQVVDVIVTNNNGCSATSTAITNTVYALPTPGLISSDPDNIFCAGTSVTFTASGGTGYNFRVNGSSKQNGVSPNYTISSLSDGQVVDVIVTNANGCTAISASMTNTVNALPIAVLISSDSDNKFCAGTSITFTAGGGTNYNFRVDGLSKQNSSTSSYTTSSLTTGQIVDVIVTNANGCSTTSAGITNTVDALPVPTLSSSDADNIFCAGTSIIFTAGGGSNYNFRIGNSSVQSSTSTTYTINSLTNGQVVDVIVTNSNGCTATSALITNFVNPLPLIFISTPQFCSPDLTTYSLAVTVGSGIVTSSLGIVSNTGGNVWSITGVPSGNNINVTVTDGNSCSKVLTVNAPNCSCQIVQTPVSGGDKSYCQSGSVSTISATVSAGETVDWYSAATGGTSLQIGSLTYTPPSAGTYYAQARNTTTSCISLNRTGITITMNPLPTANAGSALSAICQGGTSQALGGSVSGSATGGIWSTPAGGTFNPGANTLNATWTPSSGYTGTATLILTTTGGTCGTVTTSKTQIVTQLLVPNAGIGGSECDLDFTFSAVPSIGTGTWTMVSGPGTASFAPDANPPTATVTVTAYGNYTFAWTEVSNNCSASSNVTVSFSQQPVANAGTGGNNCGLAFTFNALPSVGTGTWTKTSGSGTATFSPDANSPTARVTVSSYGTYTFTWTEVNNTCSNSSSVNVTFLQLPVANAGNDGSECDKDFILNAGSGTGLWTKLSGPGNAIFSPDASSPGAKVIVDQSGTYDFTWTETNGTCQSSDVVRVVFRSLPAVSAGRDTTICISNNIQLQGVGTGSFSWVPAIMMINPNIKNPVAAPLSTTSFIATLTDQYGCMNSDTVLVRVLDLPIAYAGPDQVLEYLFGASLDATAPRINETGRWSLTSGSGVFSDSTRALTDITDLSIGENIILWRVRNGVCPPSDDYLSITVNNLVIPTLITPNMDGKNDYFVLRGIETLGKTELVIFDRRGAQVYKNSNYDNSWNGVDYNGRPLLDDTYYFVIKSEKGKSFSGYIVVRR